MIAHAYLNVNIPTVTVELWCRCLSKGRTRVKQWTAGEYREITEAEAQHLIDAHRCATGEMR